MLILPEYILGNEDDLISHLPGHTFQGSMSYNGSTTEVIMSNVIEGVNEFGGGGGAGARDPFVRVGSPEGRKLRKKFAQQKANKKRKKRKKR